ncbi:penicillin-insensitive murein endopeptidase [Pseudobdellovibrio exovorus]|uniref:Extensin-like C-terminal domain-containing protein n=1 Tax=Pseudobdellovibrio exovorus JSS TaxID=1184267 RepID=M4VBE4_9BACT|nr:penicillin-insensitive murein endopeptidase [Pseudobdellovibrio exovorus]AGH95346.1 hypothetical protein A11Q_1130 [Pseudobdellovibrio exovorus JSS]
MFKTFKSRLVFCCSSVFLLFASCAPQGNSQNKFGPDPIVNFNEEAKPTNIIPPPQNGVEYQQPPEVLTNSNGDEIQLNRTQLTSPRVHYTSSDRKLVVTANVAILDENRQPVIEKSISLSGVHSTNEMSFLLSDEIPSTDPKLKIKGLAHCLSQTRSQQVSCEHVIVDIVVSYDNKFYSEQIEVDRTKPSTPPSELTPPSNSSPQQNGNGNTVTPDDDSSDTDDNTDEDEDADQSGMQDEGSDGAAPGRYEGGLNTTNLREIFTTPAPSTPAPSTPAPPAEAPPQTAPPSAPQETPPAPTPTPVPPATPAPQPAPAPVAPAPTPAPAAPAEPPAQPKDSTPNTGNKQNRPLTPDTTQTPRGEVRPRNQAVGFPNRGRLQNATSMMTRSEALARQAYFEVAAPNMNKHFATYDMAEMIVRAGAFMNLNYTKKVYLSRVSARSGGRLPPSASHQIGNDVDLGYPTDTANKFPLTVNNRGSHLDRNYSVEKTYNLFKYLFSQTDIKVDRIFIDQKVKNALCAHAKSKNELNGSDKDLVKRMFDNLQHVRGHRDHFHLRIKCSSHDPGCRGFNYRKIDSCS